jgi:low temperature requirement protein LtrA
MVYKSQMSSEPQAGRVTSLELFFDLVFVFTITQLANVVFEKPTLGSAGRVSLMLALIWWMYGGYAWLTNTVAPESTNRRLLLLGGMAGYFLLALATPDAFGGSGLAFGLAYLAIVGVHTYLFSRAASQSVVRAILRLSPYNLVSALLVVAGGALGGTAQYVLWATAVALEWATPWLSGLEGFEVDTSHFVERHGLVLLIAIGESVVVVGVAGAALSVDASLVAIVLLGLALSASFWWLYFGTGDDERSERALEELTGVARARAALLAFFFAYLPMLLGLVLVAAAEHAALEEPFEPTSGRYATVLAAGASLILLGRSFFRRVLGIGPAWPGVVAAAVTLATVPLGTYLSPAAQLGALIVVMAATVAADGVLVDRADGSRRGGRA